MLGTENPLHRGSEHHRDGAGLDEPLKNCTKNFALPSTAYS
jgi:hypothetical protein